MAPYAVALILAAQRSTGVTVTMLARRRHRHVRPRRGRADRAPRRAASTATSCSPATSRTSRARPRTFATASIRRGARFDRDGIRCPAITSTNRLAPRRTSRTSEAPRVPPGLGYYSFTAGDWLILMLNSNAPATRRIAAVGVRARELEAAATTPCTMAVWHHPLFSSGPNGDERTDARHVGAARRRIAPKWSSAATIICTNASRGRHPTGTADPVNGIRQFTAGTGGAELYNFVRATRELRRTHHEVRRDALHAAARRRSTGSSWASTARSATAASIPAASMLLPPLATASRLADDEIRSPLSP